MQENNVVPDLKQENTPEAPKGNKNKIANLVMVAIVAAIAMTIAIFVYNHNKDVFVPIASQMLSNYPYANNTKAADGSYLKIDTNPQNKKIKDMKLAELQSFSKIQKDSLEGIKFVNEKFGFSSALYEEMMQTNSLMGRLTKENKKYRVSWSYHPSHGLEVMYEKK